MEGARAFEDAREQALASHGKNRPDTVLWLGDGATGFWNVAKRVCPDAHQILDYYHAIEHADCANIIFDGDEGLQAVWTRAVKRLLMEPEGVAAVLEDLEGRLFLAGNARQRKAIHGLRRYYRTHRHPVHYSTYRQRGWPSGSGSIESADGAVRTGAGTTGPHLRAEARRACSRILAAGRRCRARSRHR